jgi:hypothetical protein
MKTPEAKRKKRVKILQSRLKKQKDSAKKIGRRISRLEKELYEIIEKVSHAAIVRNDGILEIGMGHADIIRRCPYGTCKAGSKMGFVTSTGRYVDRDEALKIALESGQVNKDMKTLRKSGLISENIWADTNHEYDPEKGYYIPRTIK